MDTTTYTNNEELIIMKKSIRIFSTIPALLSTAVLLLCMPACAATPAQEPAPEDILL